jgi:hypothetical protein
MNNFYVYIHKRKDNGVVFYVGKGSGLRAYRPKRSKRYLAVIEESGGFTSEIIENNLTELEALDKETTLIQNPPREWNLINIRVSLRVQEIDFNSISEYLAYDENSPTGLRWKRWNNSRIKKTARYAGDVAGYLLKDSTGKEYYSVRVLGKSLLVHRIIWVLLNGKLSSNLVINHKDGNGLNNQISNLEAVTQAVNSRRTEKQRRENAGVYKMTVGKHSYYVSNYTENGERKAKLFSCLTLGEDAAFVAAKAHREKSLEHLNSLGYDYQ